MTNKGNQSSAGPEKVFKLASVRASVFMNQGQKGPFRTVKLDRRYKTEDGEWHSASSFSAQQLAAVLAIGQQALAFVMQQEQVEDE